MDNLVNLDKPDNLDKQLHNAFKLINEIKSRWEPQTEQEDLSKDYNSEKQRRRFFNKSSCYHASCIKPLVLSFTVETIEYELRYIRINNEIRVCAADLMHSFSFMKFVSNIKNELCFAGIDAEQFVIGRVGFFLNQQAWIHYWEHVCTELQLDKINEHDVFVLFKIAEAFVCPQS